MTLLCEWCSRVVGDDAPTARCVLPIRLHSEPNERQHWSARARRTRGQVAVARAKLADALRRVLLPHPVGSVAVRITRVAPRRLDADNLAASAKHVQDGAALALGIDDGDARVRWTYAQRSGGPSVYAVEIDCWVRGEHQTGRAGEGG
ncbi:MAG: hypothetical protein ACR2JV_06205 [Gaiellales bacterium]